MFAIRQVLAITTHLQNHARQIDIHMMDVGRAQHCAQSPNRHQLIRKIDTFSTALAATFQSIFKCSLVGLSK